ncbi:unnamed protein product [Schistocephalus solidus]|uniref:Uncharacterized protein n=1 Tax=Schistocephalus solidus TaxID=70667 RepID=A0A183SLZ1_SCHSO|nr:unnamed protein product [Schistocephalus solidus]
MAVYEPLVKGTAPLLSADGRMLLTERMQVLARWAEHSQSALNKPSIISDAIIDHPPEVEINADLDLPPLSKKPSEPYSNSLLGKHLARTRSLLRFTSTTDPK